MPSIEVMLRKARLSWLGDIAWRTSARLSASSSGRSTARARSATCRRRCGARSRPTCASSRAACPTAWYEAAQDRARWRDMVAKATWDHRGDKAAMAPGDIGADG